MDLNKTIIVICEGPSEESYLQELNRVFREENIPIVFVPRASCGGNYKNVENKYKKEKRNNSKTEIIIWQDKDIYIRNEKDNNTNYIKKPQGIPDFLFNINNFEDMLVLHLDDSMIKTWEIECVQKNHFNTPMTKNVYEPIFIEKIIPDYKKGDFPFDNFNLDMLNTALRNNKSNKFKFKSAFLDFLENKILEINPHYCVNIKT